MVTFSYVGLADVSEQRMDFVSASVIDGHIY